jgi:hypothetical protein
MYGERSRPGRPLQRHARPRPVLDRGLEHVLQGFRSDFVTLRESVSKKSEQESIHEGGLVVNGFGLTKDQDGRLQSFSSEAVNVYRGAR